MITKAWKVYGMEGHRQRQSFGTSAHWDFRESAYYRRDIVIDIEREDITGTNDYVIIRITGESEDACIAEFDGQLDDGIFEGSRYGKIEEL